MPESLLTIVFRGLIVANLQGDGEKSFGEFGILHTAPGHFLRINIVKNCVLETVKPITECDIMAVERNWQLEITNPVMNGVTKNEQGATFDRKTHDVADDFRWLIDLEGPEFYDKDLTNDIHTDILRPVIRVPSSQFYTRLKSHPLDRFKGAGEAEDFGCISVAVGCDIRVNDDTRVVLKAKGITHDGVTEDDFSFEFDLKGTHTIYEVVNTPPDIDVDAFLDCDEDDSDEHPHMMEADNEEADHVDIAMVDHFHHYYMMFKDQNVEKFSFSEQGGPSGPRPALCGVVMLGTRTLDL